MVKNTKSASRSTYSPEHIASDSKINNSEKKNRLINTPEIEEKDSSLMNFLLSTNQPFEDYVISNQTECDIPKPDEYETHEIKQQVEDQYPATISSYWIPIKRMNSLYTYNLNFIKNVATVERQKQMVG